MGDNVVEEAVRALVIIGIAAGVLVSVIVFAVMHWLVPHLHIYWK